jgi:hypothetical protein
VGIWCGALLSNGQLEQLLQMDSEALQADNTPGQLLRDGSIGDDIRLNILLRYPVVYQ